MKSVLSHIVQKQFSAGEDFDYVVRDIIEQFRNIADKLKALPAGQELSG